MAGTINLALTQQLDEFGQPLSGGQLYVIQAGTVSTPQNPYQDQGLTIAMPNPITLDAAGRIPMFYLADGLIKVRLQDTMGVVKFTQDGLLVIGPSSGGGGAGAVDASTIFATGDMKAAYGTSVLTNWVRCNGRTIGPVSSSATELASATAQALFQYLWNTDSTLVVSGGRGASAAADWAIGSKTIALPDCRGMPLTALSDMGNTDSGRFSGVTFTKGTPTTLGSYGGAYSKTIPGGALPSHAHNVYITVSASDGGHSHGFSSSGSTYGVAGNLVDFGHPGALQGGGTYAVGGSAGTLTGYASVGVTAYIGSTPGSNNQLQRQPAAAPLWIFPRHSS